MLVNTRDYNLAPDADDLLRRARATTPGGELKPEITQSMIEINSSVHERYRRAARRAARRRATCSPAHARKMNVAIAGGGTHPFQKWSDRKIYPTERFLSVSEQYGFLAKQFTVFGQHVHIGCASADDAIYLTHALIRYIPHFIALGGVEPVLPGRRHGVRLVAAVGRQRVSALGHDAASCTTWAEFNRYFDTMHDLGIVDEHEGLLLGHPAEARVRHGRDPRRATRRSRSSAPRRSPRTRRRWRAGCGRSAPTGSRPTSTWRTATTASRRAATASPAR